MGSRLSLSFACGLYDRVVPLYTKEVVPDGIDLKFSIVDSPREIFDRMSRSAEFDMAEMSCSEYVTRFARNACQFVAIPVFPSRVFRHGYICVNRNYIRQPSDLEGKRIGVPQYSMTAAIFMRGLLSEEYGVDFSGVHWVQGAVNHASQHGSPTILAPLKPPSLEINRSGKSLDELLEAGEIHAVLGSTVPKSVHKNGVVQRLFPNFDALEKEYFKRTRIFPIMHLVVIRREIYERHPYIAKRMYDAFCAAKAVAQKRMRYEGALAYMLPWLVKSIEDMDEVFGNDPWPYGVEANRPSLEALVRYLLAQDMIAAKPPIESLFAPVND